jgi:polyhydroxyalkanoate synthesis regulator phasin
LVKRKRKTTSSKLSLQTLDELKIFRFVKSLEKKVHVLEKRVDDLEEELFD